MKKMQSYLAKTRSSQWLRKWISYLLLLQIVAMVIPVHYVAAADQQIEIPKATLNEALFVTIWMQAFQEPANSTSSASGEVVAAGGGIEPSKARKMNLLLPETVLYAEFSIQLAYASAPDIEKVMAAFQQKYLATIGEDYDARVKKSYEEIIFTMLDVAKTIPELRPYVKPVWKILSNPELRGRGNGEQNNTIFQAGRRYKMREIIRERGPKAMQNVFQAAQTNTQVEVVFNTIYSDELGLHIKDFDAGQYMQAHPDFAPPAVMAKCCVTGNGPVKLSLNDLKSFMQDEFDQVNSSIDEMRDTLLEIDAKQDVILDYLGNQAERERLQAIAAAEAAEHQLKLEAIQSSLYIAYTLADVIDPQFAYQLSVVGNSTMQVAESLNGWMKAVAGLGTLDAVGSLSTVIMTGNVLGAVMNVASLFGSSGPTPDQMILEEIGKLRQQVEQMRQEMHGRFDRIDEELNQIYATMQDRFNLIDVQLGKLNGKVDEVQKTLVTLDLKLSRLERNNFEFLDALGRRPLLEAINGGLGYLERTGVPMPYQPEFVDFENALHGWGTIHAYDELAAGPTQRDYSPGQLFSELNDYPLDSNLNYLNGWLVANGIPAIAAKRLPSSRDWIFASRAYSDLAMEWPKHIQRINPQRQAELDAVGAEIEAAMRNISTITTMTGTVGNTLLFSQVITYYQSKLDQLEAGIAWHEANYLAETRNALGRQDSFDLYGGANQTMDFKAPEITTMSCGDPEGHGSFPAPNNLASLIPNFNMYNLAEYLQLGTLSACLTDEWLDQYEECITDNEPPFGTTCHMRGAHKAVLTVYFDDVAITSVSFMGGDEAVGDGIVKPQWTMFNRYKDLFEAVTAPDQPTPEEAVERALSLDTTSAAVEAKLAEVQAGLYRRILHEINTATLRPLAEELAGGKLLLDNFVALGFSRAVSEDELMHAMLYGNQQIIDQSDFIQSYTISSTVPITGAAILVNPRLTIAGLAGARTAAFSTLLNGYLSAITAQTHEEVADYAANARYELELAVMADAEGDAPTTPEPPVTPVPPDEPAADAKRIHLPLITR